jgi:putative transposase
MSREVHVRFCESAGVRFPRATYPYIDTMEGWLYLAVVLDLRSRRVVGWSMSQSLETSIVLDALSMALSRRQPGKGVLHRSDRGSQYADKLFRKLRKDHGMVKLPNGIN